MLANGFLVLSKIGRIAVRWSRPIEGTPMTVTLSRETDGWHVCFSCAEVPCHLPPPTDEVTGIDLGRESFATLANGEHIVNPRIFRVAELALKRAKRRVPRRSKAASGAARLSTSWRQPWLAGMTRSATSPSTQPVGAYVA
jgi:putative transposase